MSDKKIAIIYLAFYHDEKLLTQAADSIAAQSVPKENLTFVIVNNPHPKDGLYAPMIEKFLRPREKNDLPELILLPQETNLGFSGGNNVGMKWAIDRGFDYIFLLNNDAYLDPNCLDHLTEAMQADANIGASQPLLLLDPEIDLVNSAGNRFHYLGFSYCDGYRKLRSAYEDQKIHDVNSLTGAAVMLRSDLLKSHGLWDEDFFLYHEDLEYSLRLRLLGYRTVLVPDSIAYHHYEFSRSMQKYYWMERNRYATLLVTYKIPTLLLLTPILLGLELGLLSFALKGGWWKERLQAYGYWLTASAWKTWLPKRHHIQKIRKLTDHELLKTATGQIDFQETDQTHWLVTKVANPLMTAYLFLLKKIVIW